MRRMYRLALVAAMSAVSSWVVAIPGTGATPAAVDTRPNIIVMVADDLGWADVGFHGNTEIDTPSLDRLAREGMELNRFYTTPICSPTRSSLMTGRDSMRLGTAYSVIMPWDNHGVSPEEHFMPQSFLAAGYQTAMMGKWHLGHSLPGHHPNKRGFEYFVGHLHTEVGFYPPFSREGGNDFQRNGTAITDADGYETFMMADEVSDYIKARDKTKPFFIYMPFIAPHTPFDAPQALQDKYKDISFNAEQMYELKIAAWMHDIGKVTTPVEVVEKAKKLQTIFDRIEFVDLRICFILEQMDKSFLNEKIKILQNGSDAKKISTLEDEQKVKRQELMDIRDFINQCNNPGEFLEDEKIERLEKISKMTWTDFDGNEQPILNDDEVLNLSIRRGSITESERKKMQNHAAVTLKMLKKIPFTKKLKNIPLYAGAHHEFVNGGGYPLGLKGDEIPFEGKIMCVTDIAEALTASDRPYKKAMPLEVVYRILREMADKGELDKELVEFFISEEVFSKYKELHESNGN